MRGLFRRHDCCDQCCNGGHWHNGQYVGPRGGEPIPAPKKMPGGEPKEVRIITPPTGTVPAAAPALEVTPVGPASPAIVPPGDIDIRNPF
jgi:hypothetical protein